MATETTNAKPTNIATPDADTSPLDAKLYAADDFGGVADSVAGSGSLSYSALQAQQTAAQQGEGGVGQATARDSVQVGGVDTTGAISQVGAEAAEAAGASASRVDGGADAATGGERGALGTPQFSQSTVGGDVVAGSVGTA